MPIASTQNLSLVITSHNGDAETQRSVSDGIATTHKDLQLDNEIVVTHGTHDQCTSMTMRLDPMYTVTSQDAYDKGVALRTRDTAQSLSSKLVSLPEPYSSATNDRTQDRAVRTSSTLRGHGNPDEGVITQIEDQLWVQDQTQDPGQVQFVPQTDHLEAFPAPSRSSRTDFLSLYQGHRQAQVAANHGYDDNDESISLLEKSKSQGNCTDDPLAPEVLRINLRHLLAKMQAEEQLGLARAPTPVVHALGVPTNGGDAMVEWDGAAGREEDGMDVDVGEEVQTVKRAKKKARFGLGPDSGGPQDDTPRQTSADVVIVQSPVAVPARAPLPSSDSENHRRQYSSASNVASRSPHSKKLLSQRNLPDSSFPTLPTSPPSPTTQKRKLSPTTTNDNNSRSPKKAKTTEVELTAEEITWRERSITLQRLLVEQSSGRGPGVKELSNMALVMQEVTRNHKKVTLEIIRRTAIGKVVKRIADLDLADQYKYPIIRQLKQDAEVVYQYWMSKPR
ncbi:hypothetical protein FRB95_013076 [Tulasnella sp. JGI-2019a]|nr:hypothetical protein FRB95_013076 [Tulasnella sp. JGI-2019a]